MTNYIELSDFIDMLDVKTWHEGACLWNLIANRHVFVDGVQVATSTFRGNAAIIAEKCGGNYMDYYCASGCGILAEDKIQEKFMDLNVSTRPIEV